MKNLEHVAQVTRALAVQLVLDAAAFGYQRGPVQFTRGGLTYGCRMHRHADGNYEAAITLFEMTIVTAVVEQFDLRNA